jgi:hypothetical protein
MTDALRLYTVIDQELKERAVTRARLKAVAGRLLANGALVRDENRIEERLYDDAVRIGGLLADYFDVIGFRLMHDADLEFFRLHPPTDEEADESEATYGDEGADDDGPPVKRLRATVGRDFSAVTLVLRFLYQQQLNGGATLNERLEVVVNVADIISGCQNLLGHALSTSPVARKAMFDELKRHRLIRTPAKFEAQVSDSVVAVRRYVLTFASDEALARSVSRHVLEDEPSSSPDAMIREDKA